MMHDLGLLLLRLGFGGIMLSHGWVKIGLYSEPGFIFPDPIHLGSKLSFILAIFAEAVCSALVVAGLATRLACVPVIFTMLVAFTVVHSGDPWGKKEMAVLYGIGFLAILLLGPGRMSLDAFLKARKQVNAYR